MSNTQAVAHVPAKYNVRSSIDVSNKGMAKIIGGSFAVGATIQGLAYGIHYLLKKKLS